MSRRSFLYCATYTGTGGRYYKARLRDRRVLIGGPYPTSMDAFRAAVARSREAIEGDEICNS